ncbi:GDSL lipase/esterase [Morchella snyderi]|nr:GDSL lipase/esterase [Morchella snyderi]
MFPSLSSTAVVALSLCSAIGSASVLPRASKQVYPGFKNLKYLFTLGDSYTASGFNLTNGSPLPTSGNPLGNPVYPGWTSANGPNWVDYLTVEFNKTELLTYNLAYGGATIDADLVTPYIPTVLSLKDQVEGLFVPILGPKPSYAPWKSSDSLFLIWIGINDIGGSYWNGDFENFHTVLMDEYFALIEQLYTTGARNFVFVNVPPVDRSPLTIGQGAQSVALEAEALESYNGMVETRVKALKKAHKDVWAQVFDSSKLFNKILDHPSEYGLKNTTGYCESYQNGTPAQDTLYDECLIPVNEYFWLNSLHPTAPVHKVMAKELAKTL